VQGDGRRYWMYGDGDRRMVWLVVCEREKGCGIVLGSVTKGVCLNE